jgi:hypothetical protein
MVPFLSMCYMGTPHKFGWINGTTYYNVDTMTHSYEGSSVRTNVGTIERTIVLLFYCT